MHRFNIFILLLSLYSCAGYVEKLHQQMDKENLKRGRSLQSLPGVSDERSVVGSDSSKDILLMIFKIMTLIKVCG